MSGTRALMRRSFRTRVSFSGRIPRVCTLGWYAMPRWGMGSKRGGGIGSNGAAPTRWNAMPRWGMDAGSEMPLFKLPQRGNAYQAGHRPRNRKLP
jgi:hypothetical protein